LRARFPFPHAALRLTGSGRPMTESISPQIDCSPDLPLRVTRGRQPTQRRWSGSITAERTVSKRRDPLATRDLIRYLPQRFSWSPLRHCTVRPSPHWERTTSRWWSAECKQACWVPTARMSVVCLSSVSSRRGDVTVTVAYHVCTAHLDEVCAVACVDWW